MIGFILRRSPRYLGVSLACLAVNSALLIGFDRLGWSSGLAVLASAAVMIPLAFLLHATLTYSVEPGVASFLRYAAAAAVNTPVAWLLLLVIHDRAGLPMELAAPLIMALMFLWNFLVGSWAILARRPLAH